MAIIRKVLTINVPVVGSAEFVRGNFFMEWGISDLLSTLEATIFVRQASQKNIISEASKSIIIVEVKTKNKALFYFSALQHILRGVFYRRSVGELLFEGYADEVMELGESMMEEAGEYEEYSQYGDNGDQSEEQSSTDPNLDKFGWFYKVHCYV